MHYHSSTLSPAGVPISTQWEPSGHQYPIQIAQFGLSHYSKQIVDGPPKSSNLLTGNDLDLDLWRYNGKVAPRSMFDRGRNTDVIEFQTSGIGSAV